MESDPPDPQPEPDEASVRDAAEEPSWPEPGSSIEQTDRVQDPAQDPAASSSIAQENGGPDDTEEVSFPGMIEEALRVRARSAHGIVQELHRLWPGFLEGKEGYVHPVLLELRREGRLTCTWEELPEGRRRVYRLATGMTPAPPERNGRVATLPSYALRDFAARCASELAFAPRVREEAQVELAGHLADAAAERVGDGTPSGEAETDALSDFGDPWRIRVDLGRAARGKRTVIFPRSFGESLIGFAIYDLRVMLLIVAAMVFVRLQVVTAYHIPTKSMEPTLHGDPRTGDHILVNKLARTPERFDIWVFDGWAADRKNYVKRVVGLPGETIDLWHGDLYVDGNLVRKEGRHLDALLFPLFDLDDERARAARISPTTPQDEVMRRLSDLWHTSSDGPEGAWVPATRRDGLWARIPADWDGEPAELYWDDVVEDELYDPVTCELGGGIYEVADVRVTVDIAPETSDARVRLRLQSDPEAYEAVLLDDRPGVSIRKRVTFLEEGEERHEFEELARAEEGTQLEAGSYTRVRFSHVDRRLRLELDGRLVLSVDLPGLEKRPSDEAEETVPFVSVSRGSVAVRPVRLERDVHWNDESGRPLRSPGEDEFFMLGDNSNNSTDSRSYGPAHGNRLVGTPLMVVWPFSGIRIVR